MAHANKIFKNLQIFKIQIIEYYLPSIYRKNIFTIKNLRPDSNTKIHRDDIDISFP